VVAFIESCCANFFKNTSVKKMKIFSLKNCLFFFLSIVLAQMAGIIGITIAPIQGGDWYQQLIKPSWTPPGWIFGPIWFLLYTLIGIAAFIIWLNKSHYLRKKALFLYFSQLSLNAMWMPIFAGMQNPGFAFFEIILLLLNIIVMNIFFYKISHIASYLIFPYIFWVTFATVLNFAIWMLN
jgi:tryptophan-rich sensory protein